MKQDSRIYVAGGKTMIGSAIVCILEKKGYTNVINKITEEPDLTNNVQVDKFFKSKKPEYVFLTAGKSGGIATNQDYPASLIYDNLLIECHVINSAYIHQVKKLLYLASSCTYPKHTPQPMKVESLLKGKLEPTNQAYAIAKIAGMELCRAYHQQYGVSFITGISADAFGPGDNFDLNNSHVIAALIRKMHEAKENNYPSIKIWGSGKPKREFIYVDDLADACFFLMQNYDGSEPINVGSGTTRSIAELAEAIKSNVGFEGEFEYDVKKKDGMPVKTLDSSPLFSLGWEPSVPFLSGLERTYSWFSRNDL